MRCVSALDNDVFNDASTAATKSSRLHVFRRLETIHTRFKGGKFDHHVALEGVWPFIDLVSAASRKHFAPVLLNDGRHTVGVFLYSTGSWMMQRDNQ
jgi:hypothetical protein